MPVVGPVQALDTVKYILRRESSIYPKNFGIILFLFFLGRNQEKKKYIYIYIYMALEKGLIYIIGGFVLFGCECTKYSDIDCVGNLELAFQMGIFYSINIK